MHRMPRRMPVVAAVAAVVFVFGNVPAAAADKAPVRLDQKVNIKGTKNASKKAKATVKEKAADFSFSPTFVKAKAGQKITFKLKNVGGLPHTFTSDSLSVHEQVSPGRSVKFTVTVPDTGSVFQFHCDFHESSGMAGAVFTKAGAQATSNGSTTGNGPGGSDRPSSSGGSESGGAGSGVPGY